MACLRETNGESHVLKNVPLIALDPIEPILASLEEKLAAARAAGGGLETVHELEHLVAEIRDTLRQSRT